MKISICGLGYVGSVTAACMARAGHRVIGVDINPDKVAMICQGVPPVLEAELPEVFAAVVESGHLTATTDLEKAVAESDVTLVAVGTPSRANGSLDTCALEKVCEDIGRALRHRTRPHTLIIRSTVLPGTTRNLLIPILEEAMGRPCDAMVGVVYNPEFMREGTSVADFYTPPFTILGGDDASHLERAAALYVGVSAPLEQTRIESAEMLKYACNAFHALKVSFANEIGDFAADHGVDGREVMRLLCLDKKLNVSTAYLKPGFAFGGSCLPKDLRAMLYRARQMDMELPLLSSILCSNREQLERGLRMIFATGKRKVGMLGLTFKSGTDDLRESPYVDMAETLIGKGFDVLIHDDNVAGAHLIGANERYIQSRLPHFSRLLSPMNTVLDHAEVIVVCNRDPEYIAAMQRVRPDQIVIDLASLPPMESLATGQVRGIAW